MLQGKTALITGGASGIGRALGEELARRGAHVVLADIDGPGLSAAVAEIRARGGRADSDELDVRDLGAFRRVAQTLFERSGHIDYLFNNAGVGTSGEIARYSQNDWDSVFDVNVRGVAYGIQAVYPLMREQRSGHIINTASLAGLVTTPGLGSYTASKHAVVGLTKALRIEASVHGVRASVLCPGVIRTPLLGKGLTNYPNLSPEQARQLWERLRPMDVNIFARKAVDAVLANRAIIVIPSWARAAWILERWAPALAERVALLIHEQSQRELARLGAL